MVVSLTASLVASADPQMVQLVLSGVAAGAEYVVRGTTGTASWAVPGGVGTSTGSDLVLVDNRAPVNVPVTYQVTVSGATTSAAQVTVPFAGRYLVQSLDGQTVVVPRWLDNGLPQAPVMRANVSDVPGRPRPPVRYATGGDGGGSLLLAFDQVSDGVWRSLLRTGGPLVVRADGAVADWPATDLITVTSASSTRRGDGKRVWSVDFLWADDPEPSTVLSAWTWTDFDDAMATRTWDDFDSLFAALTWADFDTYPWGQL